MEQLIRSSDLSVMQVEMDVYTALKKVRAETPLLHLVSSTGVVAECAKSSLIGSSCALAITRKRRVPADGSSRGSSARHQIEGAT